mgnify:CR=1 FL=1
MARDGWGIMGVCGICGFKTFFFKDGCVSKCGTLLSNFFFFFFPEPTLNRLVYSGAALRVDDDDEIIRGDHDLLGQPLQNRVERCLTELNAGMWEITE